MAMIVTYTSITCIMEACFTTVVYNIFLKIQEHLNCIFKSSVQTCLIDFPKQVLPQLLQIFIRFFSDLATNI